MYYTQDGGAQESSPRRSVGNTNTIMVPPSLLMGQAPRYDEVYYPRTDKRKICKFVLKLTHYKDGTQYQYEGNDF